MIDTKDIGIKKFKFGSATVWDMRSAPRGRYTDNALKSGDYIIWSDRKVHRAVKNHNLSGSTFVNLTKTELNKFFEDLNKGESNGN